jgi:uncharacterized protein YbjT (DUF2867 family)
MENLLSPWFLPGLLEGKLLMGIKPETRLQMIAVDDIGKYGLMTFEQREKMNGVELDIAGDEHTMPQTDAILSRVIGKKIDFVEVAKEEVRKVSADYAIMLEWFDRVGYDVDIPGLEKRYNIKPTVLTAWAGQVDWKEKKAA